MEKNTRLMGELRQTKQLLIDLLKDLVIINDELSTVLWSVW
jgi:hypothetical protein